jgi:acetolactate decarboxylase
MSLIQFNPFSALQQGFYDGSTTIADLKRAGDFAIGAMNALDGEMVGVDNVFYRVSIDGALEALADDALVPWALATHFHRPEKTVTLPAGLDYAGLRALLDELVSANRFVAFRVEGIAAKVKARSAPRQTPPYPPLNYVVETPYEFENVTVTGVGFRCPSWVGGLDPAGCHLHMVTADRKQGGHVIDWTLSEGTLSVIPMSEYKLHLPDSAFDTAPAPNDSVVGTWQMVEAWDIGDDPNDPTKVTYPWGNPPSGYWVYDSSGNFGLQISLNPPLPIPDGNANWLTPTPPWEAPCDLLRQSLTPNVYYAYFGTYTVDYAGGTINQQVFTDVLRSYTGTAQPRPFRLSGGDLIIGDEKSYIRRFKRLTYGGPSTDPAKTQQ